MVIAKIKRQSTPTNNRLHYKLLFAPQILILNSFPIKSYDANTSKVSLYFARCQMIIKKVELR